MNTAMPIFIPDGADPNRRSRLARFERWLNEQDLLWYAPDLAAYRDYLLGEGLATSTVISSLSTVRARYTEILKDDDTRDILHALAEAEIASRGDENSPANRAAFVSELEKRLSNALDPDVAWVRQLIRQDRPDDDGLRLTKKQASRLLRSPGVSTLVGLRDTTIIGLLLCTGIREAELCALQVSDLRQQLGGNVALHVRKGKGSKERLVPYGALVEILNVVDLWLERAGIEAGPVIRGFWRGGRLRSGAITTRQVQNILKQYPIEIDGEPRTVRPHDLRRTYARRLYEENIDLVAIQQNLGHSDYKTTLRYIGALGVDARRPPEMYGLDELMEGN